VVERFRRLHPIPLPPPAPTPALHVGPQAQLDAAVLHFLDGVSAPQPAKAILEHRLMEVLLCLVTVCDASHMLLSMSPGYAGRLQALLHTDPARNWRLRDVCARLGVSESALRRHLREELTCFRELLEDLRMGQALAELQLTALPISAIAGRCGYASFSRFSARFRRRFRVSPSQLRRAMTG
jgi:AraC-like DNA-binding protein